jgi:hypothetical protein
MEYMINRYPGKCHACGCTVAAHEGYVELKKEYRKKPRWLVWCQDCFNKSDNSGPEDRACGDRAYEDWCASKVGY